MQECVRCGSLSRFASDSRCASRCSYASLTSYPPSFRFPACFVAADYNSQHAERLGWLLSFRSTIRLHFPESRRRGMGGARSPRAGSNGPNVRGAGDREGEGLGPAGLGSCGLSREAGTGRAFLFPGGGSAVCPRVALHRKLRAGGCCSLLGPGFRAWEGAGGEAFGAGAGRTDTTTLPCTALPEPARKAALWKRHRPLQGLEGKKEKI